MISTFKTTLFTMKALGNEKQHLLINGCSYPNPAVMHKADIDSEKFILVTVPFTESSHGWYIAYPDQGIEVTDGKALVKGKWTDGTPIESTFHFTLTEIRSVSYSDVFDVPYKEQRTASNYSIAATNTALGCEMQIGIKGYKFTYLEGSNVMTVQLPDSEKTFTITDLGKKVEIEVVNSELHRSILPIQKQDE